MWEVPKHELLMRIQESKTLHEEYESSFHKTRNKLKAMESERQWDFSENYIFGKFDAFCKRLDKIADMINTIDSLSSLNNVKIEGMESVVLKYKTVVDNVKKKNYDILDHRKSDFDNDYVDFKSQIEYLQMQIQTFIDTWCRTSYTCQQSLEFLDKFQRLEGVKADYNSQYSKLLQDYAKELDIVRKLYEKNKHEPMLSRNLPPISGRITWARQLYRRINTPIKLFSKRPEIIRTEEAKQIVKNYNKMAQVLLEYELIHYRLWCTSIDMIKSGLNATILVRNVDMPHDLVVNFDPHVFELIKEAFHMRKIGLDIPQSADNICLMHDTINENIVSLREMIDKYVAAMNTVPKDLVAMMKPHRDVVEQALRPGLTSVTWTSTIVREYIQNVHMELDMFGNLIGQVRDILECRVESVYQKISVTSLCDAPLEPVTIDEFVKITEETVQKGTQLVAKQTILCESAVNEIIETLKKNLRDADRVLLKNDDACYYDCIYKNDPKARGQRCLECLPCSFYNFLTQYTQKNNDALIQCTKYSFDAIKRRLQQTNKYVGGQVFREKVKNPLFKADVILAIPNVTVKPTLDDMQAQLNKSVQSILKMSQDVPEWLHSQKLREIQIKEIEKQAADEGEDAKAATVSKLPKPLSKTITEHKDIAKLVISLSSIMSTFKDEVQEMMKNFTGYSELWEKEADVTVKQFMQSQPLIVDFEAKLRHYKKIETEIEEFAPLYQVGSIVYITENLKRALLTEILNWKLAYGKAMNEEASANMKRTFDFIEDLSKRLARPCKDLDDIRAHMKSLNEIKENEITIDLTVAPIEETYTILNKYEITFNDGNPEKVDTLSYAWKKLQNQAREVQGHLLRVQPDFKSDLLEKIAFFKKDSAKFFNDYRTKGPMEAGIPPKEASDRLTIYQAKFDELWRKHETYSGGEELLGLPMTEYADIPRIKKELNLLQKLYGLYNQVIDTINGYYDIPWVDVNIDKINGDLIEFQNRCRKLPKGLKEYQAFNDLKRTIDDFNETCPLLEMMANKSMKDRHWTRIANLTSHQFDVESDSFLLRDIMAAPLLKNKEEIEDICISAVKEKDIEAKLKLVIGDWSSRNFEFSVFKSRGELLLKGDATGEIITMMEDSLMILSSLMSNRYNLPFKKQIQEWVQKLTSTTEIIENWMVVQNLWIYLEAVFVGGDIAKQLPAEAKRFSNIDKSWQKIMQRAHETTNVVACCVGDDTLAQLLPHLLEQLELCQKSLTGYLEKKRLIFPRFFFVSDPALLEILGQASDSHTIQVSPKRKNPLYSGLCVFNSRPRMIAAATQ